ncbi:MAG: TonB family protein [Polyangia bacterium]
MAAIPITIQVFKGGQVVRTEKLNQETIKIGKISSAHLQLEDESVSRLHANIEVTAKGEVTIVDLQSSKGTFVNGSKLAPSKPQRLNPGDEVKIGDVRVVLTFEAPAEAADDAEEVADASVQAPAAKVPAPAPIPARPAAPPMAPGRAPAPMPSPFAPAAPAASAAPAAFSIPPVYGPKAFVPAVPPQIADQVEVRDGSRAVEVSALFDDAVLTVRHLDDPARGKETPATKGMVYGGFAALIAVFLMFVSNYFIVSHEKHIEEEWEKENAAAAADKKKDKPPRPRGSVALDYAAVALLIGGIAGLGLGLSRRIREREENEFTLGTASDATFKVPDGTLPVAKFPLVRSTGTDYEMLFTQQMTGEMQLGGKVIQLSELASSGQARPSGDVQGAFVMPVPNEARVNVKLGDAIFSINSVAKPRAYPVPFHVDWGTQSYTIGAFAIVGLFMALMFSVPPDPKSLSLDAFMNDQRLAKFLVKPEEQKPEEIPDWLKKQQKEQENSGGKRAKEAEGKMGKKDSNQKNKIFAIKGPPTNTDIKLAKEAAKDAALKSGVLGILKGGQTGAMASIFGRDSALGRDASDALGGLVGTEVGDAYGAGGFGLVGAGQGGGGTGEGTIGLGNLGTIGRGSGAPGGGMYGSKAGQLKGRKAGAPEVVPGTAEVRGSLDKELIRRIIRRHINEVKFCYEKELTRIQNLEGRVMIQFTISPTGAVAASFVQSSTMNNPPVEQCIAAAVRRWEFPKPQGGIVIVTYPFVLKAAGGE